MARRSLLLPLTSVWLASCAVLQPPTPEPTGPAVGGKIDYRELELLPRGAQLEVQLERDGARDDGVVAEWIQVDPGQAPFDFELDYDPEGVTGSDGYTLRARITKQGRLLFLSTEGLGVNLWREVQRIEELEEARQAEVHAQLAEGDESEGPTEDPEQVAEVIDDSRPLLDVGKIVLTKVPATVATAPLPNVAYVRGRAETRLFERLPEGARLHIWLLGTSDGTRSEIAIDEWEDDFPGDAPLDFELHYAPEFIEPQRQYVLRAEVTIDGMPAYRTTGQPPVDLNGALQRMRQASLDEGPLPDQLTVANLQLVRIPGAVVTPPPLAPEKPVVRGKIHYPGQELVPAGSVLVLRIVGTSTVDRSEQVLAQSTRSDLGPFPLDFDLAYDPEHVDATREYSLLAEITSDDVGLFKTTSRFAVDFGSVGSGSLAVEAGTVLVTPVPRRLDPVPDLEGPSPVGRVNGRVVYLGRRPLPTDAVLRVKLFALSPTLRTEELVAEVRDASPGQVPIDFTIEYDPEGVDGSLEYIVRAELTSGEQPLYLTTRRFVVDIPEAPDDRADWQPAPANAGNVLVTEVPR